MQIIIKDTGEVRHCELALRPVVFYKADSGSWRAVRHGDYLMIFDVWLPDECVLPAHDEAMLYAFEHIIDVGDIMSMLRAAEQTVNEFLQGMIDGQ